MPSIKRPPSNPEDGLFEPGPTNGYVPGQGFARDPWAQPTSSADARSIKQEDHPSPQMPRPEIKITSKSLVGIRPKRRRPEATVGSERLGSATPTRNENSVTNVSNGSAGHSDGNMSPGRAIVGRKKVARVTRFRGRDFTTSDAFNRSKLLKGAKIDTGFKRDLLAITSAIDRFAQGGYKDQTDIATLRTLVSKASVDPRVNNATLIDSGFMADGGVKRIFTRYDYKKFPVDVVDDICALFLRWGTGNLDSNLMRGFHRNKHSNIVDDGASETVESTVHSWKMEEKYQFKRDANFAGDNELYVGQWWPYQAAAYRDGAHGERQAGIASIKSAGAISIVMSGTSTYGQDEDNGHEIWYCGTAQTNSSKMHEVTRDTAMMDLAYAKKTRIRVLRANKGSTSNIYRPSEGIRYDGLYVIVGKELVDRSKQLWRYRLVRLIELDGGHIQAPIRHTGPAVRPTQAEIAAFQQLKNDVKKAD